MRATEVLILFLGTLQVIWGQDIIPRKDIDVDPSRTETGVSYVDISGLGEGRSFYQATSLDIQLLDTDPVFTIKNTFRSENFFYGESDDNMIALSLLRYERDDDQVVAGVLYDRQRHLVYEVRRDANRQQTVRVIPEEDIPQPGDPIKDASSSKWQQLFNFRSTTPIIPSIYNKFMDVFGGASSRQDCVTTITAMIVWTESSECYHSDLPTGCDLTNTTLANMEAVVNLMIEETNTAFVNSNIDAQLELVHTERDGSGYKEGDMRNTLGHISGLDCQLDYIQWLRFTKGADLVQMIVDNRVDAAGLGGIAYLPRRNLIGMYDAGAGFSVVCAQCMSNYISAHEFGHNLGCFHDRGTSNECSACANNYGYRSPTGSFRTIMAYPCKTGQCDDNPGGSCPVIPYFSGEDNYTNGESMGGSDNNCRAEINRMKGCVALYRYCQCLPIPEGLI